MMAFGVLIAVLAMPMVLGAVEPVMIFAAASVEPALEEVMRDWRAADGATARGNYAASSQLARQIEQGAAADLFLSADERWMDALAGEKLIAEATRVDLLGNHLVLIAPAGRGFPLRVERGFAIAEAFTGRVATTDPSVPLGAYARESFLALGWMPALEARLLPMEDAHAALRLIEMGEVALGVAYRSDAAANAKVSVIGEIPDELHTPIRYPLALLATARPAAHELLALLRSAQAREIFRRHGFADPHAAP
jgi:molybdate transport system substrate-binding protein